jgi:hypothetical protein
MPRHSPYRVELTAHERGALESLARKYTSPYRNVIRAKIVLLAAEGLANDVIAARLDTPRQIVSKWRKRFCLFRLTGQYVVATLYAHRQELVVRLEGRVVKGFACPIHGKVTAPLYPLLRVRR